MLKAENLYKRFKKVVVAEGITLELENRTYGLLGKNGSGKTTLLRCITKTEKLNAGRIYYTDESGETEDYLNHIGYLPQNFEIFGELTAGEVLQFFANLRDYQPGKGELDEILAALNISEKKDTMVKKLSGGMKRRLGIAQAMVGNPGILLLDEPTAGLDPEERVNFKKVIQGIKKDRCVVLSTHIITDIESLCDTIFVLKGGKLAVFNSCAQLAGVAGNKVFAVKNTGDIRGRFSSLGEILVNGEIYEKVICEEKQNALPLTPTVEDGYICFTEDL